mmetsp:Transcript_19547/g.35455  ORF Transcript_19547/g.35455 Transcript_19547/m.35455 type:complete len:512 (-) Transcript_19547:235-1770(-)
MVWKGGRLVTIRNIGTTIGLLLSRNYYCPTQIVFARAFCFSTPCLTRTIVSRRTSMDPDLAQIRREQWLASRTTMHTTGPVAHSTPTISSSTTSRGAPLSSRTTLAAIKKDEDTQSSSSSSSQTKQSKRKQQVHTPTTQTKKDDDSTTSRTKKSKPSTINQDIIDLTDSPQKGRSLLKKENRKEKKNHADEDKEQERTSSVFSIASYNVWFGEPHPAERMKRIASLVVEKRPTFVGMQELTNELAMELVPRLESAGYHVLRQGDCNLRYGCAIAVDLERAIIVTSGFLPFSTTIMERGLMFVHAKLKLSCGSPNHILFTTTHLESFLKHGPSHDGARQRQGQLLQSKTFCDDFLDRQPQSQSSAAILTGDFNWDDERKRSSGIDKPLLTDVIQDESWSDAWLQTRPGQEGYTYDAKINPMLGGNLRRRFDRCLVRTNNPTTRTTTTDETKHAPSSSITIERTELIGQDPIEGIQWHKEQRNWQTGLPTGQIKTLPVLPSDHYGLLVTFGNP